MRRIRLSAALSLLATILMSTAAPAQNAALSGTVSFQRGPSEYAEKFRGTVAGSVSPSAMTLQIGRLCDTSEDAGCVDGGTLVLEKSS